MNPTKNVTIKSIAEKLGVSISTVSRALKNNPRIGLKTREAVLNLARQLKFTPNPLALNLQNRRTNTIGLIIPTMLEEFFSHIVSGVEKVTSSNGFNVIINQSYNSIKTEKQIVETYIKAKVDGILVSISSETNEYSHFTEAEHSGIPLVFYDRFPRNYPANIVKSDVSQAITEIVDFFSKRGIKKIALLNGPSNLKISDERLDSYLKAIKYYELETRQAYIKSTSLKADETYQRMCDFIQMKEEKPQAVICFNDYVLIHAMKACRDYGLIPNQDIYFASFANISMMDFFDTIPYISVEQFPQQMGLTAANLLFDNILGQSSKDKRVISIHTKLLTHPEILTKD